eukprot:12930636-Prorocentrum_lima.AAC.1
MDWTKTCSLLFYATRRVGKLLKDAPHGYDIGPAREVVDLALQAAKRASHYKEACYPAAGLPMDDRPLAQVS